jgi:small subunit ribosomal protein S6
MTGSMRLNTRLRPASRHARILNAEGWSCWSSALNNTHGPLPACQDDYDHRGETLAQDKLNPYETVYIIRPNLDEDAVDRTVAAVEEFIKAQGGNVETTDKKGRRRLAYEVDKMRDGYFVLTVFHAKPESVAALKRMMTLSEDIIRSLIVVHDKESAKTL